MAAAQRHRTRAFVMVYYFGEDYLIYKLNLKRLFSDEPDDEPPTLRCFPRPAARFQRIKPHELMGFAASGTKVIIAATSERRTMFHDTDSGSASSGPDMHAVKYRPILLPVGDDMFFVMSHNTLRCEHPGTHFEALLRPATGRWAWRALREPPVRSGPHRATYSEVTAYFVAGARVWISLLGEGTFSFDTVRRQWRKEGTWKLPVRGRAILVPDLLGGGRQLLFGFCSKELRFCACDMEARPPVIREAWGEAYPREWCERTGFLMRREPAALVYFGGGRFCISRHVVVERGNEKKPGRLGLSLMAVEVTPELKLLKRKHCCYLMSPSAQFGYLL